MRNIRIDERSVLRRPRTAKGAVETREAMKVIVLVSGGMDSVAALYDAHAKHEVAGALSFKYGSKHNLREIPFAALHCEKLGVPHRVIPLAFVNELFTSHLLASGGEIPDG